MSIQSTQLRHEDHKEWCQLFSEYCGFYNFDCSEEKLDSVWQWLFDPQHNLSAIAARNAEGRLIGFAHYQAMPLSLFGSETGYLADLYVDPSHRRQGVATLLHQAFIEQAQARGWPFAAWLTQEGNQPARNLYDKSAQLTDLRYYVQPLTGEA